MGDGADAGQLFPPVCPGENVQLSGLAQAPQYNGQVGLCLALEGDSITVALRSGKQLKVCLANAVKMADGDDALNTTAPARFIRRLETGSELGQSGRPAPLAVLTRSKPQNTSERLSPSP